MTRRSIAVFICGIWLLGRLPRAQGAAEPESAPPSAPRRSIVPTPISEDWPMWGRFPQRTFFTSASRPPIDWDAETGLSIKWSSSIGTSCYSTPVVCGGVVYIGTNNERARDPRITGDAAVLMAFRESDGKFLWQRATQKLASGRVNDWPGLGIISTPCVDRLTHRLWYCTNRCEVVCLDVASTEAEPPVIWSFDMIKNLGVFPHNMTTCAPMVWEDYLYIITANGVDDAHQRVVAPAAPAIVCFNKNTGEVVWKDNSPGKSVLHGQWSNPTLARARGRTLVIAALGDSWIYAFDARGGQIIWTFDGNPKDSVYPQSRNEIIATPIIVGQRMYIGMGQDPEHGEGYGRLWCVDITGSGDVSAELPADPNRPRPALGDMLRPPGRPNPNSKVIWQYEKFDLNRDGIIDRSEHMNRTISSAAIDPATNLLFIPDFSGFLHCLDAATGRIYWTYDLESAIWGSPLICDGKVYIGDEDGEVVVFQVSKEKQVLAKNQTGAPTFSSPIFANGVMYLATREKLLAVEGTQ